ncbi:MAG: histidine kinase [Lachnospiraceae bacterium]|nr:histidine kinase [Lachnospiraceae bacterium]
MDDLTIRHKLVVLYVFCVILPLVVTDGLIFYFIKCEESNRLNYEMNNIVEAVEADIVNSVEEAVKVTRGVFINRTLNEFLDKEFSSPAEYYSERYKLLNQPFASMNLGTGELSLVMYTDNPSILSGGPFCQLDTQKDKVWYKALNNSDRDFILTSYYIGDENKTETYRKRISLVRKLDYYKNLNYTKIIKADLDYSGMAKRLMNMNFSLPVYVCDGKKILYSNVRRPDVMSPFRFVSGNDTILCEKSQEIYGMNLRVMVLEPMEGTEINLKDYALLIFLMILSNILLPAVLMFMINKSFVSRLKTLSAAFEGGANGYDTMNEISDIRGEDEIGSLMRGYNNMVVRQKELIKTVYEERLKKQEIDIERQQAQLLALHSQINPHFLFNVLESIRMHSIIKREEETADMIERLAILQRQNVDWSDDHIKIKEELKFIEAYLELQKYRFGDKLSYGISIKNGCENYYMPRLTLETFVENACVHGVENKVATTYIYIRIYEQEDRLYMEVEDTGEGMDEDVVESLNEKLRLCSLDDLKSGKHIGMINACLRLKMLTNNRASVQVESERGIGTTIFISIPKDTIDKGL